ncbi:hypothetical protein ABE237_00690 [Brevibacillus formosus]|uniref:hypothetical protein n=1 Tax=Brevibacillus formosus TaxID=54913 RepID=UPI0018CC8575|nr:hypothetical protein [Brevibacillus formosus]MBG9944667.1 hypothetical protein [Brevibacillus formosus]
MSKYRKKPVVIEAKQYKGLSNYIEICEFVGKPLDSEYNGEIVVIETLEGTMRANAGDYIIKGVKGEFYPCKPDIFEATYDAVE